MPAAFDPCHRILLQNQQREEPNQTKAVSFEPISKITKVAINQRSSNTNNTRGVPNVLRGKDAQAVVEPYTL